MWGTSTWDECPWGVPGLDPELPQSIMSAQTELFVTGTYRLYTSTHQFTTEPTETPPNQPFAYGLTQPLRYSSTASGNGVVSGFASGDGEMVVDNIKGTYDFLGEGYALDGRDQEVRLGGRGIPWASWFTVFKGTASNFHVSERSLHVYLSDYGYKLDEFLLQNTYAGTGGVEGNDDLKGKRKPRLFGYCDNITPIQLSSATKLYQVNDGPVQAITDVYANGVPLTDPGTDHATPELLLAATITSGHFHTCKAYGLFRINYALDGTLITCDVQGDNADGFAGTVPEIVRRMALTKLRAEDIHEPGFADYANGGDYEAGYYVETDSQMSIRDAISDLLGVGSYAFFTRAGKLSIVRLQWPEGPPVIRLDPTKYRTLSRDALTGPVVPAPHQWRVGWGPNFTVQRDVTVAGSVSDARKAWLTESVRFAIAEDDTIKVSHPFSKPQDAGGFLRNEVDAETEAARLLALHRRSAALYRIGLRLEGCRIDHGDIVFLQSDRYGLTDGKYLQVIARSIDAGNMTSEIVGFGG